MKFLREMDLYRALIVICLLAMPVCGWWCYQTDLQIKDCEKAISDATRSGGVLEQIGALQKLEDKIVAGAALPTGFQGTLDVSDIDTVPAELLDEEAMATRSPAKDDWLDTLRPGDWVRMFLQGRWVQARLLWPGDRREVWLFGDGASDATWAIRRGALLNMHAERLAKTLRQRSIVGSAAAKVQEQIAASAA